MMIINIFNQYQHVDIQIEDITTNLEIIFSKHFPDATEASLVIIDQEKMHQMNLMYRQIDRSTDVLSFSDDETYLGDIFINYDDVISQAAELGHSKEREFAFLLCHGLLHLLGYDHIDENDAYLMFEKQNELLNQTPYVRKK